MSEAVKTLQERRLRAWEQAKAIADRGAEEDRALSGEEERQWDSYMAEMKGLDDKIHAMLEGEKRAKEATDSMDRLAGKPVERATAGSGSAGGDGNSLDGELRDWLSGRNQARSFTFGSMPTTEYRSLLDSNTPLPTSFVGQLYSYLVDTSSIRQANPRIFATSSGDQLVVPVSTAEGSAHWTAEGGSLTAGDPTFNHATLSAYKLGKIIQISSELLEDEGFDVTGFLAESAGRNLGIASDAAYVNGTGTNQPTGFLQTATAALTAATGTGSTVGLPTSGAVQQGDVLIELYHSVIPQYRPRASYIMNDATIKVVRKVKDTIGQYIWQPGLQAGEPDMILGRPVYADPNMPTFGASNVVIAFGDFGGYFVRDVQPIRFERSNDFAFGSDLISFRAVMRTDGILGDTNSVKTYVCAAS